MIDKLARLKNLECMSDELLKIAHNKDLSLEAELRYVKNLKQTYINKQAGAQNDKENLTLVDHTPARANTSGDEIGRDTYDEFQNEWSEPARDAVSSKNPITQTTKISVFKKEFTATPITDQKKFGGYDISDATGKKILNIKSKDSQPMTKDQLEFCAKIELTRGLKQAKLVEKVAFLEPGSKVYIIASDKSGKRVKFASMEQGIRGWAPVSKFAFINKEGEMRKHKDHIDNTFGHNGKEILVDCPNGSGNMVWLPMGELLPITPPPATPESLNDLESEKQCPDCHGTFEGAEGETCPTCGRFAVQKTALKPALPPQILNRRMEVDASGCDQCAATMINGVFCHETGCPNQKRKNRFEDEDMDVDSSLKIQAHIRHENGKWIVYNHDYTKQLGRYKTKAEAVHRLKSIEYWKNHKGSSTRPFSKKAEVLSNPYQSLTDHITDMKSRMNQVQDRLQTAPVVKAAVEDAAPELDLPGLFADLTQGIELLETKLGGDGNSDPEVHMGVEELENKLWELEEKLGLTPELSEEEKAEPEHASIVEDIENKKKVNKSAIDVQVTDETVEEGTGTPPPAIPTTMAPTIQNVQPTDDDNLNVPVAMPSSPTPPGTKWVFDTQFNKYVIMPDGSNPGKTI